MSQKTSSAILMRRNQSMSLSCFIISQNDNKTGFVCVSRDALGITAIGVFPVVDGAKVKNLRLARGLNQRQLAERSGVTLSAISGIEQGKRNPQPRTQTLLADALEVEPTKLLQDDANMQSLIEDGATLWHLNRPESGWSKEHAKVIDEGVLTLARKFGMEKIYLWLARDAWEVVGRYLQFNMMLRAPGVSFDVGPVGTETPYCFIEYKADPESKRPKYIQAMLEGQGLVPRSGKAGSEEESDGTEESE